MTSHSGHGFLYDLIQLRRQILNQNTRKFFFTTFGLKSKENNENDMTSVVWAGTVFGPHLWPISMSSLAHWSKGQRSLFFHEVVFVCHIQRKETLE